MPQLEETGGKTAVCLRIKFARYFDNLSHGSPCCLVKLRRLSMCVCVLDGREIVQKLSAWLYMPQHIAEDGRLLRRQQSLPEGFRFHSETHVFVRHDATRPNVTPQYDDPLEDFELSKRTTAIDMRDAPDVLAPGRVKPAPIEASAPAVCHVRFECKPCIFYCK